MAPIMYSPSPTPHATPTTAAPSAPRTVRIAYAYRDGAHSFHADGEETGPLDVAHGVPEVAYAEVTRRLAHGASARQGRPVTARPALPFDDFFTWLRMTPIAAVAGAPVHVEFAWELR